MKICWVDIYLLRLSELKFRNDFIKTTIKYNIINRHLYDSEIEWRTITSKWRMPG